MSQKECILNILTIVLGAVVQIKHCTKGQKRARKNKHKQRNTEPKKTRLTQKCLKHTLLCLFITQHPYSYKYHHIYFIFRGMLFYRNVKIRVFSYLHRKIVVIELHFKRLFTHTLIYKHGYAKYSLILTKSLILYAPEISSLVCFRHRSSSHPFARI